MNTTPCAFKRFMRIFVIAALTMVPVITTRFASRPASKDYISYWSAGQLLMHHSDPYSYSKVFAIEKTQGYSLAKPLIMRNPPWTLFLVFPLGWLNAVDGLIVWMAAGIACVAISLRLLNVASKNHLFAYLFAPALASFSTAQSSPFLLLGFALFLRFNRTKPYLAGTAMLLMTVKSHLFLVFWPILLADCLERRNYRLLLGGAGALMCAAAFAMYLQPGIWSAYFGMLHDSHLDLDFIPTPALMFRFLLAPKVAWVQLLPAALGIAWAIWFYISHRRVWDWSVHGMPLILVTVLVSPYAWMTDEIVLLPAIMFTIASPKKSQHSIPIFIAINGIALVMVMTQIQLSSGAYIWTSTAWLGWYLYSQHSKPSREPAWVGHVGGTAKVQL